MINSARTCAEDAKVHNHVFSVPDSPSSAVDEVCTKNELKTHSLAVTVDMVC